MIGIAYLFPSEGPRLKDMKISASTYGAAIPETFGVTRVAGNLIWSTQIQEHRREKMAGKGGFYNKYTYTCSFAMAFCRGPVVDFRRLWANGKLIYDVTGTGQTNNSKYKFTIYKGTEYQLPNLLIEADKGTSNTPAYRGMCYLVFEDFPLEDFGNQLPQMTAEVYRDGTASSVAPKVDMQIGDATPGDTFVSGGFTRVDPNRGYVYIANSDVGIRRLRLNDAAEDLFITDDMMAFTKTSSRDSGTFALNGFIGVDPHTGYMLVQHGFRNYVPIDLLDPNSYTVLATVGSSADLGGQFEANVAQACVSTNKHGVSMACYLADLGAVYTLTMDPANFTGSQVGTSGGNIGRGNICAANNLEENTFFEGHPNGSFVELVFVRPVSYTCSYLGGAPIFTIYNQNPGVNLSFSVAWIAYDEADPGILIGYFQLSTAHMAKWSFTTNSFTWDKVMPNGAGVGSGKGLFTTGVYAWVGSNKVWGIDTINGRWLTGDALRSIDPLDQSTAYVLDSDAAYSGIVIQNAPGHSTGSNDQYWDPIRKVIVSVGSGTNSQFVYIAAAPVEETNLAVVVSAILREGGLTDLNMDMTRLESTPIYGYGWARGVDIKGVLDDLRKVYLFDIVESDGKLIGVMRGAGFNDIAGSSSETILQDALGSSAPEASDFWQETRIQEADLPERVSLSYMNIENDYQTAVAHSTRISNPLPTMFSRQQVAIEVTVVMTPTEAKARTNAALYTQWSERVKHATRLPWSYLDLDPADLITVNMNDGRTYLERLHMTDIGADFTISMESFGQDNGSYSNPTPIADGGSGRIQAIFAPKPAKPIILNTPLLRDLDDTGGSYSLYYSGVATVGSGEFEGGVLYRSLDPYNYDILFNTDQDVEWGTIKGVVPTPAQGNFSLDWKTQITIWPSVTWFELSSITDDELWAGANACVVGDEIIQFRDCVQNANGSWTIWNLLRGRRGTEYACDTHVAGESFVFLSTASFGMEGDVLDSRGQQRYFKALGSGSDYSTALPVTLTYEPRDLMPYAPKDIRRYLSTGSITVEWKRRTRTGGNMQDFTGSVPLNETRERYEVYLYKTGFTGDLSRGGSVEPGYVYSLQTTDTSFDWSPASTAVFDVNLDTLTVVVYQISSAVGRGFPGVRSIEPWREF